MFELLDFSQIPTPINNNTNLHKYCSLLSSLSSVSWTTHFHSWSFLYFLPSEHRKNEGLRRNISPLVFIVSTSWGSSVAVKWPSSLDRQLWEDMVWCWAAFPFSPQFQRSASLGFCYPTGPNLPPSWGNAYLSHAESSALCLHHLPAWIRPVVNLPNHFDF